MCHAFALGFHVDRLVVQYAFAAVQMLDEFGDTAGVLEFQLLRFARLWIGGAFVGERDLQAFVQEGQFAQALRQRVIVVFGCGEDFFVGKEMDFCAALFGGPGFLQFGLRIALGIALLPDMSVAPDFQIKLMAERVYAGNTNAMKSAGNFVIGVIKLSSGMQLGQHHLRGRNFLAIDHHVVHGNSASVIDHGDGIIDVDCHIDLSGISCQRFIHGVVNNFINQMVKSHLSVGADIHSGAQAYRFHALKHFYIVCSVVAVSVAAGLFAFVLFCHLFCCCSSRITGRQL